MKKLTSGQLCTFLKNADKECIFERKNVRYFCKKENLDYTICQGKWLIDLESFIKAINPSKQKERKSFPRMRTKRTALIEWNSKHRTKIKHHIIDRICDSGKIFVYKHGRYNIINYDQLEVEIIEELRRKKEY